MNPKAASRLALGAAATASSASAGIVIFDFPDVHSNTSNNTYSADFGQINLASKGFTFGSSSTPSFTVSAQYAYLAANGFNTISVANSYDPALNGLTVFSANNSISSATAFYSPYAYAPAATLPTGVHYLGLRLTDSGKNYYGWFEFTVSQPGAENYIKDITFTRFAFNDVAGQTILAGQTTAVPEASTLGFASGLFGLVAAAHLRRRQQNRAAASDKFLALAAGEKLN